jgi:threonine aldolase
MTTAQFKRSLQAELNAARFANKILKVVEIEPNLCVRFTEPINEHSDLAQWLNHRFKNGISLSSATDQNLVIINTPNQSNKNK